MNQQQPEEVKGEHKKDVQLGFQLKEKQEIIYDWCKIGNGIQYVNVCTGRQVGKTTTDLVVALMWSLGHKDFSTGFFLPTYKQCDSAFRRLKKMLGSMLDHVSFNKKDYTVTFWNGSSVQFFTADNDNCRGFTFDAIIVDEACFIKDSIWTDAIEPTVAASLSKLNSKGEIGFKGKVLLTSTPKTKNWFYGMVTSKSKRSRTIRFTSEEGGIIHREWLEDVKLRIPEQSFRNEYLGEFIDAGNGLFRYLPCVMSFEEEEKLSKRGLVAGLDVASKGDYTCLTIMDKLGNLLYIGRWTDLSYHVILPTVAEVLVKYGSPVCFVETNGVGQMPIEHLRLLGARCREWHTSNKSKSNIIMRLQVDMNLQNIRLLDRSYLKDELDYFACEWKNGNPVYGGSNGMHDDSVMSLAICNYHIPRKKSNSKGGGYTSDYQPQTQY